MPKTIRYDIPHCNRVTVIHWKQEKPISSFKCDPCGLEVKFHTKTGELMGTVPGKDQLTRDLLTAAKDAALWVSELDKFLRENYKEPLKPLDQYPRWQAIIEKINAFELAQ